MQRKSERGVTLFEISLVVLIAGLLIAAVVGGRAIANMARKNAIPKQVNGVIASFQAYVEDRGSLPGDTVTVNGVIDPVVDGEDAPLAMIQDGFLDGGSAQLRTVAPTVNEIILPSGLRGVIVTSNSAALWGGTNTHVLRIPPTGGTSDMTLLDEVEESLDDGAFTGAADDTTGSVRVDFTLGPPNTAIMEISLD